MKSIIVLLTLFSLFQATKGQTLDAHGCPKGWIRLVDRCYYISPKADTFEMGSKYCKDRKAQLAPGLTCEAHMNLVEVLADHRAKCPRGQRCDQFWMGIKDVDVTAGKWRTDNDLQMDQNHQCQQWTPGSPNGNGRCGTMNLRGTWKRGAWKNVNCTDRYKYVCITCPNHFDYVPLSDGCYLLDNEELNWKDAQTKCSKRKRGAHLMHIHDSKKQEVVENYLKAQIERPEIAICHYKVWPHGGKIFWLGGQSKILFECKSPFVWRQVGAPDIEFSFDNWYASSPNCGSKEENCLMMPTSDIFKYRWDDFICHALLCSLCEF